MLAAKNTDGRVKYIQLLKKIEIKLNFIYIINVKRKKALNSCRKKTLLKMALPTFKMKEFENF